MLNLVEYSSQLIVIKSHFVLPDMLLMCCGWEIHLMAYLLAKTRKLKAHQIKSTQQPIHEFIMQLLWGRFTVKPRFSSHMMSPFDCVHFPVFWLQVSIIWPWCFRIRWIYSRDKHYSRLYCIRISITSHKFWLLRPSHMSAAFHAFL